MKTSDFNFDLPPELIAQTPLPERDKSRLMVLDKDSHNIQHKIFRDILDYLEPNDCLVLNNTRVIPARLLGEKEGTGGKIEFLLLKRIELDKWEVLVKPGKKAKVGAWFTFGDGRLRAEVKATTDDGGRIVEFHYEGVFEEILDELGKMPLPPYITAALEDAERYQTVYSKHQGSAAAPTAGLHFTKELLDKISSKGVKIVYITLHVGLGTFRPVKVEDINDHKMHSEFYMIEEETASIINTIKGNGGRIVAVGTTCCRTLEAAANDDGLLKAGSGWTDIFIYPGYKFKLVDWLITNFHLPESTLIMLVSALAGGDFIMEAYKTAVKERYRFFSFGDGMLIK